MQKTLRIVVPGIAFTLCTSLWAHGPSEHKPSRKQPQTIEETEFGRAGDPGRVGRTIQVSMRDEMRFVSSGPGVKRAAGRAASAEIRVNAGDTVRFIVSNEGKAMHEMVIGTMAALKEHAELMKKHPAMEHAETYMAHVGPGKRGEIVWQFTKPGEFHYACLVAGHFEAGMIGKIVVLPAKSM